MTGDQVEKDRLRKEALSRRNALDATYRIEAGLAVAEIGKAAIAIEPGDVVAGFWPIRTEIDIRPLMFALYEEGARLCLPAILDKQTIVFRELIRGAEFVDMGFGTAGPGPDAQVLQPGIMLMPLAAYDDAGNRIGYGAGYYDRAIAAMHGAGHFPRLIGCAFDCQKVSSIPAEPHDVPLETIITESGLRSFADA